MKGWQSKTDGVGVLQTNKCTIYKHLTPNLPHNPKLTTKAKALRKAGVLSEVLFWQQVHQKKFYGIDFDQQCIIGQYIVDFYVKSLSLVIEIDGSSHLAKGGYDEEIETFLASLGLNVYRIEDKLIKRNIELVMRNLEDYIIKTYSTPLPSGTPLKEGSKNA